MIPYLFELMNRACDRSLCSCSLACGTTVEAPRPGGRLGPHWRVCVAKNALEKSGFMDPRTLQVPCSMLVGSPPWIRILKRTPPRTDRHPNKPPMR